MTLPGNHLSHPSRAMFYSHDTYGLGHLRRTMTIASHLQSSAPDMSQLIVTGSPMAHGFCFPPGTDYIKLPSVTKDGSGAYQPLALSSSFSAVRDMRGDILLSAAQHFQPDYFLVDHAPAGMTGECLASLRYLKESRPETKLILGMRDIIDEAPRVRQDWSRDGIYELLDDVYDLIIVYGYRGLYDVVGEYGLSTRAAAKTCFVGYLGREPGTRSADEVRASLPMQTDKLVVVTAGGGGDGKDLFESMLHGLEGADSQGADFDCLIVRGPLMSGTDRTTLLDGLGNRGNVHFLDFTDDMASYLGAADVVVSMGGYNSVCEILSLGRPSIIVPRVSPRKEQLIRAEGLSRRGMVEMIHPHDLTPDMLMGATRGLLSATSGKRPSFQLDGLQNLSTALGLLMPQLPQLRGPWLSTPQLATSEAAAFAEP